MGAYDEVFRLRSADVYSQVGADFQNPNTAKHGPWKGDQHAPALQRNWIWLPEWKDAADDTTVGRFVTFVKSFTIESTIKEAVIRCSADTRYKLFVNGQRAAVGPTRSSETIWYYDTLDIKHLLRQGENELRFVVLRFFPSHWGAHPFVRTSLPGLTVAGSLALEQGEVDVKTDESWKGREEKSIGLNNVDNWDIFLQIYERIQNRSSIDDFVNCKVYGLPQPLFPGRNHGELTPWRLQSRIPPMPEETPLQIDNIRRIDSPVEQEAWAAFFRDGRNLRLPSQTRHYLELQAPCHSTAFLRWIFSATGRQGATIKVLYSEGYESEPRQLPSYRVKSDRLDASGQLIGHYDEIQLSALLATGDVAIWEPFWFRTFFHLAVTIQTGNEDLELRSFSAAQTNYPLAPKGYLRGSKEMTAIWDMSVRTLRNCMFDGYSDCPYYEQLQYAHDTRSSGLFHYLLSGDDRLMKQAILGYASSLTAEGLIECRYPSTIHQIIPGFALFWILQVNDHLMYFNEPSFIRPLLSTIDRIFDCFEGYVDGMGLISGLPPHHWQYVDWAKEYLPDTEFVESGVPAAGRKNNIHTFHTLLYAFVLNIAADLLDRVSRHDQASSYRRRADAANLAAQQHCFDGSFFTDSLASVDHPHNYSQHCQVLAVLSGAMPPSQGVKALRHAFDPINKFIKCSYVMMFYAFRAFAKAGVYEEMWDRSWEPWRTMIKNNMTTCEEDDVRQRSDCHAWGAVAMYEYPTEVAGLQPLEPGWTKISWTPRVTLVADFEMKVALGRDNVAIVQWKTQAGRTKATLSLDRAAVVVTRNANGEEVQHGQVTSVEVSR